MELELARCDLLQLNPMSYKGTMQLLPISKNNSRQKIVVGDDTGMLHCYDFKRGEPVVVFEAQLFENQPVTCLALGGDNPIKRDKLYASSDQKIVGISKKGKQFFTMSSSSTEAIRFIHTEDTQIWTGCDYICNVYDNGRDKHLFMSMDTINDLVISQVLHDNSYDTVLACQDSCVRIVNGSDLEMDIPTVAPVRSIVCKPRSSLGKESNYIIVGTDGGEITLIKIAFNKAKRSTEDTGNALFDDYTYGWTLEDSRGSTATSMLVCDLTHSGEENDLVVAREDGRVEVYVLEPSANNNDNNDSTPIGLDSNTPKKVFSSDLGERVQGLVCGRVNHDMYREIVVSTYSGKVISFTSEPLNQRDEKDAYGRSTATLQNERRIKHLEGEIETMRTKVTKERATVDKVKETKKSGEKRKSSQKEPFTLATAADFSSAVSFFLDHDKGAYMLSVEIQSALDFIVVRSSVELEVVDTEDDNTTLVSVTPSNLLESDANERSPGTDADCKFIAALHVPKGEKRAYFAVRPIEGQHGDMLVTIVTNTSPKLAKVVKFPMKRLSLHSRVHNMTQEDYNRPRCQVKFTGNLPMPLIHDWLQDVVAEVPPHFDESTGALKYYFRNVYTKAVAVCELSQNQLVFESQSASSIAIFKEGVTTLANQRRVQMEERFTGSIDSMYDFLGLLRPHVEHLLNLSQKDLVIDAIQELVHAENGGDSTGNTTPPWLTPKYTDIYRSYKQIKFDLKHRQKKLEYITGIITDLHVDWHKLRGIDARSGLPEVAAAINAGNFDGVIVAIMGGAKQMEQSDGPWRALGGRQESQVEGAGPYAHK